MRIIIEGTVIGESSDVLIVGREHYFPSNSVKLELLERNSGVLHCPDKGYATCYDVRVGGHVTHNGAWEYLHPYPQSSDLKGRIGFRADDVQNDLPEKY